MPPRALRAPGRIQKGTRESDIHTGHRCARPSLRSARRLRPREGAERSKGPSGCSAVRLPTPCWLRLRRGGCGVSMGVEAPMLRELTRRGCPSGARSAKRVPRRTPQPPRRRRSQQGVGQPNIETATRAFASLGPVSRAQAPRAAQAGPSAAMARVDVRFAGSLLYAPGARRARGGTRVGARVLRELTHRSCPSGAPQARSEFCGAPRGRAPQVAP